MKKYQLMMKKNEDASYYENPLSMDQLCSVNQCFLCPRCDYKVVSFTGKVLKNFNFCYDVIEEDERYMIYCYDKDLETVDIPSYLNDDTSNYMLVRNQDQRIIRPSLQYRKKKAFEFDMLYQELSERVEKEYGPVKTKAIR